MLVMCHHIMRTRRTFRAVSMLVARLYRHEFYSPQAVKLKLHSLCRKFQHSMASTWQVIDLARIDGHHETQVCLEMQHGRQEICKAWTSISLSALTKTHQEVWILVSKGKEWPVQGKTVITFNTTSLLTGRLCQTFSHFTYKRAKATASLYCSHLQIWCATLLIALAECTTPPFNQDWAHLLKLS